MLNSLRSIVQEVNAAQDLASVLGIIVTRVSEAMKAEACSVYLKNEDRYVLMATQGLNNSAVGRVILREGRGLVSLVGSREEPINLENAQTHPAFEYFPDTGEDKFSSFLGVPIIQHRKVLGVLVVQQSSQRRFDDDEEAFLVTLSTQLSSIIAHAEATGALKNFGPRREVRFFGVAGAPGVGMGQCTVISPIADLDSVPYQECEDIGEELVYFFQCLAVVREDIKELCAQLQDVLNREELALFDAYLGMLADASLAKEVTGKIEDGVAAPYAWSEVIKEHVRTFAGMNDAYLRERASDVKDLGSRVLSYLQQSSSNKPQIPENAILVGEDLTASTLAEFPRDKIRGIVSVRGSSNSHIAILARSLGIPTVMGALDLPFTRLEGRDLIVDGYRGTVYSDPGVPLRQAYQLIIDEDKQMVAELEKVKDQPCETLDHHRVALWVNTGLMADAMFSIERGAEGVGLYRTEIPFMLSDRFPSEEQQRVNYREQLEMFAPHVVTMRTLDIGGDKSLSYFPINEENPFLGWRGIRVTLDQPEIFLAQVRAMLKASEGLDNLRIMLPMVSNISELEIAQMLISRALDELIDDGLDIKPPPIGVMIEVPAAVYQVREFAKRVDFLSVGSNDLTQYLLAVDRNNARVADLYHSLHPAVLRALDSIVKDGHAEGTSVGICGELAGEPAAALLLVAMGYDVLSMSATNLLRVKSLIRSVNLQQADDLLKKVMQLPDVESINRCIDDAFRDSSLSRLVRPSFK